jgi:hypothetical protein
MGHIGFLDHYFLTQIARRRCAIRRANDTPYCCGDIHSHGRLAIVILRPIALYDNTAESGRHIHCCILDITPLGCRASLVRNAETLALTQHAAEYCCEFH